MDINKVILGIKDLNNNLEEYKRVLLSVDSKHLSNVFGNDITKIENYKNTISGLMGLINVFIPTMKNALSSLGNDKSIENMTKQINECKVAFDFLKESEHVLKTIKGITPSTVIADTIPEKLKNTSTPNNTNTLNDNISKTLASLQETLNKLNNLDKEFMKDNSKNRAFININESKEDASSLKKSIKEKRDKLNASINSLQNDNSTENQQKQLEIYEKINNELKEQAELIVKINKLDAQSKKALKGTKSYVKNQEILSGEPFKFNDNKGYKAQMDFYSNELKKYVPKSDAYIEVLSKYREAEKKLNTEIKQQESNKILNYVNDQKFKTNKAFEFNGKLGNQAELEYYKQAIKGVSDESDIYYKILERISGLKKKIDAETNKQAGKQGEKKQRKQEDIYNDTKNFVKNQQILTGKEFQFKGQSGAKAEIEYYNKQLSTLKKGTQEYIDVLELRRKAEQRDNGKPRGDSNLKDIENKSKRIQELANEKKRKEQEELNRVKALENSKVKYQQDAFNKIKNHVKTQETMTGKEFTFKGQSGAKAEIEYYNNTIKKLATGSKEYIAVLELRRQAEQRVSNEAKQLADQQAKAQQQAQQQQINNIKNYVKNQETLSGDKFKFKGQSGAKGEVEYYNQQLGTLKKGTQEYIDVLELRRKAEQRVSNEVKQSADQQVKAQQQAMDNMRNKMLSIASTISSVGKAINNTINQIIGAIRKILSVVKTVFNGAISIVVGFKNTVARIIELFGNLGNRVRSTFQSLFGGASKANGSLNILKGTATELKSKIDLLKMAFNTLFNNTYMKSAETLYQSIYSLKNIVGEELTQNTIDWANSMENAFGISARGLISDLNELSGVLYGLGMKAEDVAIGSQNILMTSRYLAFMGAAGGQVEVVMSKLNSGMKGMTQAIDDLGLSVREAQMDSYLKSLKAMGGEYANIGTSFASLNEEARVYVRYASLMQQLTSKYDLTNFADALTTTTGRISVLRESIKSLKTVVGQGFIEAFGKIAGYITYIVRFIEKQVIKLAGFFNVDLKISKDTNKAESTIGNVNNSLGDTKDKIEDIEKAAKKASKSTLGFDKIQTLSSNSSDSDKAGGNDFDYSKLFSSGLDGLNAYAEAQENYMNNLESEFKTMLSNISKAFNTWAKEITGREDFNLGFDSTKFKSDLNSLLKYTDSSLSKIGRMLAYYALSFADDFNIGSKVNEVVKVLSKSAELIDSILNASKTGLLYFYDNSVQPIAKALGFSADDLLNGLIIKLDSLISWFDNHESIVTDWFVGLSDGFNKEIENIKKRIPELLNAITGDKVDFAFTNATTTGTWNNILNIVNSISRVMQTLWKDIVSPLLSDLGTWGKNEFLPWMNEELGRFADWLDSHAEQIKDILAEIGRFAWEGFKAFVDVVGKLVNYAVENPEAVVNIFKGLIGLKIGSWAMNQVGGITTLLANMALLKGGGLTGLLGGAGATAGASAGATAGATGAGVAGLGISAGAIAGIVAAIAGAVVVFADLWKNVDGFKEHFQTMTSEIGEAWSKLMSQFDSDSEFGKAFGELKKNWEEIRPIIAYIWEVGSTLSTSLIEGIISGLGSLLSGLITFINGIINVVMGVITGSPERIITGIAQFVDGLLSPITAIIDTLVTSVLSLIGNFGENTIEGFKDGLITKWESIKNIILSPFTSLIEIIKKLFGIHSPSTVFADIGSFLVQGLSQGINNAWSGFKDGVLKLFGGIKDNIIDIFSKAKDGAIGAWSNAKDLFSGIASNISSAFNGITKSIGDIFTKAKNKGVEILGELGIDVRTSGSTQSNYKPSSRMASVQSSVSIAKFAGFRANGGAIPNGSVIVGNEGGNLEMYGKMAGGMSVAANNNMITTAIYKAVRQAVADGTPKNIEKQSGGTIINTPFLIADESSLRQLKRMLAEI